MGGLFLIVGLIAGVFGSNLDKGRMQGDAAGAKLELAVRVPAGPDNQAALNGARRILGPEGVVIDGQPVK